jgi:hypothetical protein
MNYIKEEIIGVIPRLIVNGSFATWDYVMFITTKRITIIQTGFDDLSGGSYYLDIINYYKTAKKRENVKDTNLDTMLADHIVNKEIPMEKLVEIKIKKNFLNHYRIVIFGMNKRNAKKKLFSGYFALPEPQIRGLEGNKILLKQALDRYTKNCQDQFEHIFSNKLTQKVNF